MMGTVSLTQQRQISVGRAGREKGGSGKWGWGGLGGYSFRKFICGGKERIINRVMERLRVGET